MNPTAVQPVELKSIADTVEIAPGVQMPRLGLGTWRASGGQVQYAVRTGFDLGYRLLDTSANYGNEREIGIELSRQRVPRRHVFVTTKLEGPDQGYRTTGPALEASLSRLGLDYVDLYLIHWPNPAKTNDTWRAMEELLDRGLTRAIGVSNFEETDLEQLFTTAHIPPAVNQIELHPLLQRNELQRYHAERGIVIQAWRPVLYGRTNEVPTLVDIGRAHNKTAAQVSIRWILQKGITTIPKSVREQHLRENAEVFDFELSPDEMQAVDALDRFVRSGW